MAERKVEKVCQNCTTKNSSLVVAGGSAACPSEHSLRVRLMPVRRWPENHRKSSFFSDFPNVRQKKNIRTMKRSFKNKNRKEQGKEIVGWGGAVTPKGCVCVANN